MNYQDDDPMAMYQAAMMRRGGGPSRRFDAYFRCYPIAMLPGPDRDDANHGGKIFLPPSALDKLTRMHISYPMLFELINGEQGKVTHAGVLEFIAEEGKIYLPYWLMQTLSVEPGDLLQIKSTDLPSGTFIKLQPQDSSFLDITDPKAVLENAFRNFSCMTTGDIFTFSYNDTTYSIAVLETRPANAKNAICTLETDLSVDFAPPVGYEEEQAALAKSRAAAVSGTSTPRSISSAAAGGTIHPHGTMAQAINYAAIAPESSAPSAGAKATSSNFLTQGHRLASSTGKKASKAPTPNPSTPVAGASSNNNEPKTGTMASATIRRGDGPQPLRLPPGKLFFGYAVKPLKKKDETAEEVEARQREMRFQGAGNTLRRKKGGGGGGGDK